MLNSTGHIIFKLARNEVSFLTLPRFDEPGPLFHPEHFDRHVQLGNVILQLFAQVSQLGGVVHQEDLHLKHNYIERKANSGNNSPWKYQQFPRRPVDNGVHRSEQSGPGLVVEDDDDARGGQHGGAGLVGAGAVAVVLERAVERHQLGGHDVELVLVEALLGVRRLWRAGAGAVLARVNVGPLLEAGRGPVAKVRTGVLPQGEGKVGGLLLSRIVRLRGGHGEAFPAAAALHDDAARGLFRQRGDRLIFWLDRQKGPKTIRTFWAIQLK